MGIQEIAVALLFLSALVYIGQILYKTLTAKKSCSSGCGKCGVDFSNIKVPHQGADQASQ